MIVFVFLLFLFFPRSAKALLFLTQLNNVSNILNFSYISFNLKEEAMTCSSSLPLLLLWPVTSFGCPPFFSLIRLLKEFSSATATFSSLCLPLGCSFPQTDLRYLAVLFTATQVLKTHSKVSSTSTYSSNSGLTQKSS